MIALVLSFGVGYVVTAQDSATPTVTPASDEVLCATPIVEASGTGTPAIVYCNNNIHTSGTRKYP